MRTNITKAKLLEGEVVFGAIIGENSPGTVELFGAIGYDFVMIDCEHGSMTLDQVENMVRAAEVFGITPLTRIPDHSETTILGFLDRGVQGIIVPHVNTRAEAEAVADAARYHPDGHRGAGTTGRAHDYGVGVTRDESVAWVNSQVMVIPMIEDIAAVGNLDEILTVPGLDVIHVAAGDLGQSMGYPAEAEVHRVVDQAIQKIKAAGKVAGAGHNSIHNVPRVVEVLKLGARFVTIGTNQFMRRGAEEFRSQVLAGL